MNEPRDRGGRTAADRRAIAMRGLACWHELGGDLLAPLVVEFRAAPRIGVRALPDKLEVMCTAGLIELLTPRELRAVMAHEKVHLDLGHHRGLKALPWLLLRFPAPVRVIASTVARHGEFVADRGSAKLTGDPLALASALRRIRRADRRASKGVVEFLAGSAHPRMSKRIRRLEMQARRSASQPRSGRDRPLE